MSKKRNEVKTPQPRQNKSEKWWKNLLLFGICLLLLVSVLYPLAFQGKRPGGVDVIGSKGASHQITEFQKESGEDVLWNKTVFSGMPIYHRKSAGIFNFDTIIHKYLDKIFYRYIWLYLVGFTGMFYLLRFFKLNWWACAFAALGFILIPHFMSILSIGHFQKFRPVMYMPFVTFFFLSYLHKKNILWLLGFIFSITVQIRTQHYQVMFYQIILLLFLGGYYLINLLLKREFKIFALKIIILIPASILIVMMVAQPLFVVNEYTPYSIRGGTGEEGSSGLDTSYATNWSMHPLAVFNWTMPRFFGGTSSEKYTGSAVPQLQGQTIRGYWGYMPFTQTYDYIGIVMVFLALIGVISGWRKGIIRLLGALFLLGLLLSFGRHFQGFYNIFFNHLPYFNKFRVPAMMQLMLFFITVIFAGFGLDNLLLQKENIKKPVINATIFLVLSGFFPLLFGSSFQMLKGDEVSQRGAQMLAEARLDMMVSDGWRLILYALAAGALTLTFLSRKIKPVLFLVILAGLLLSDQVPYLIKAEGELNNPEQLEKSHFRMKNTDQILLKDESYFRVFPITENPFNSNDYSYYHNSIGGYNAAKLRIYQDIIEKCLYAGKDKILPLNWNIMKMLNTKYIISKQQLPGKNLTLYYYDKPAELYTYQTSFNARPAWFAGQYEVIPDREARLAALNLPQFDAYTMAILEEDPQIKIAQPVQGNIEVIDASYNHIKYKVSYDVPTLFVASEIYYPAGWKCFVDGEEKEIYKTDHVLRSIYLDKPGIQEVEFVFTPETYLKNLSITRIGHLISWTLLIIAVVITFLRKKKEAKTADA
ncbi:MAG: hypothetical protein K9N06_02180 [Candidatus Cloacimonetes bacterium]|nr:hypothetical protein [Candidatus Cloacimonadota bacterium]